jgi:energy-coupling factor transport system substrate-specific component
MLMGLIAGLLFHNKKISKPSVIWRCALVTVPASALSALIETILFDGITSAVVTTLIIQTLSKTSMKLFGSAFLTQAVTDYVDKFIAIVLVLVLVKRLPYELTHFESKKEVA